MIEMQPFSDADGPIIDVEQPSSASPSPKQDLILRMDKYPGWSRPASDCLNQTTELAKQFNHATVGVAHLIVAMTLVPNAIEQLQRRNIDVDTAFRAAMMSLIDMERAKPGDPIAKTSSTELTSMLRRAGDIAKNRDFQEISVDDLLTALDRLPPDSPAARPIRGGQTDAPAFDPAELQAELQKELQTTATTIVDRVRELIPPPPQPVIDFQTRNDLTEIKSFLQAFGAQLSDLKRQISLIRVPEPAPESEANENKAPEPSAPDDTGWMGGIFRVNR